LNCSITVCLIVGLSVPWFEWKWSFSNGLDDDNIDSCFISHQIGWFQEYCTVSFWCNNDASVYNISIEAACEINEPYWRQEAASARIQLYDICFSLCMVALGINLYGLFVSIYRLVTRKPAKVQSLIVMSQILMLVPLVLFPVRLPLAYSSELGDNCLLPQGPPYNETILNGEFFSPCIAFVGSVTWTDGSSFSWNGSGIWSLIPAVFLCLIMNILYFATFREEKNNNINNPPRDYAYQNIVNAVPHPPSYPPPSQGGFEQVEVILKEIGMKKYIKSFKKHAFDYDTFLSFPKLSTEDQDK